MKPIAGALLASLVGACALLVLAVVAAVAVELAR